MYSGEYDVCDGTQVNMMFVYVHPHRAGWKVCLTTVGIEPAIFGILVHTQSNITNIISSTSLQIQGHSRPWIFVFKFKDIQRLSSFVRTLIYNGNWWSHESKGGSSLICKEGCRFSMGWCMREPYCPLSSAVCNATIPTLLLFEMAESAYSMFCYVLYYLLFIKFI
jgi:hypothetical protein